jgi:ribosome-associated translation inhibitor RaiA
MEVILHAHHAKVSDSLRQRAERAARKLGSRLKRAVTAIVRFEDDGPARRVEIVLQAPRHRDLVAIGEGARYGPALTLAVQRLQGQVAKARVRQLRRTLPAPVPETPFA